MATGYETYDAIELNEAETSLQAELSEIEARMNNLQPYWDTQAFDSMDCDRAETERDLRNVRAEIRRRKGV